MYLKAIRTTVWLALGAAAALNLGGCAALSCDNFQRYDDILDSWVGADLDDYERRTENRALRSMERPRDVIEYEYNTPYYNYDGSQMACRTWLHVERSTGRIVGWRYEGDCYMHGHCAG